MQKHRFVGVVLGGDETVKVIFNFHGALSTIYMPIFKVDAYVALVRFRLAQIPCENSIG